MVTETTGNGRGIFSFRQDYKLMVVEEEDRRVSDAQPTGPILVECGRCYARHLPEVWMDGSWDWRAERCPKCLHQDFAGE